MIQLADNEHVGWCAEGGGGQIGLDCKLAEWEKARTFCIWRRGREVGVRR
jgi:hypothetical protein